MPRDTWVSPVSTGGAALAVEEEEEEEKVVVARLGRIGEPAGTVEAAAGDGQPRSGDGQPRCRPQSAAFASTARGGEGGWLRGMCQRWFCSSGLRACVRRSSPQVRVRVYGYSAVDTAEDTLGRASSRKRPKCEVRSCIAAAWTLNRRRAWWVF